MIVRRGRKGDKTTAAPRGEEYIGKTTGATYQVHVRYEVAKHEECHGCCVYTKRFILPY